MKQILLVTFILFQISNALSQGIPNCSNAVVIGTTQTDAQAIDGSPGRIIYEWPDNTIAACWNMGYNWPLYLDRGTGYNFFNGNIWGPIPSVRLESVRSGFPNIIRGGPNEEIIFSHNNTNLNMLNRINHGTGLWNENSLPMNFLWPRVAHGGPLDQTIHLIYSESMSGSFTQDYPMYYSRSDDNGLSWSVLNFSIPQLDSNITRLFSPSKNIACRGNVVAIVTGGFTDNLILTKSVDNGNTWINTIINQFPIPLYNEWTMITDVNNDGIVDTVNTTDRSTSVIIDNNDIVHVWVGNSRVADWDSIGPTGYFLVEDGLLYWNESMGPNSISNNVIATLEDLDNDGYINLPPTEYMSYYNSTATSMPTAGINDWGHLFVAYSAFIEDTLYSFPALDARRNIYEMKSLDNGQTWTTPFRVCPEEFVDQLFPSMAEKVYDDPKIIFFRDTTDLPTVPSIHRHKQVVFISPDISTEMAELNAANTEFHAWQSDKSNSIHCLVPGSFKGQNLIINVYDFSGRLLYNYNPQTGTGKQQFELSTPSLKTGLYLVTLDDKLGSRTVKIFYQQH